jgi:hypothetical protein
MITDFKKIVGNFWGVPLDFESFEEFNLWHQRYKQNLIKIDERISPDGIMEYHAFLLRDQATMIYCHVKKEVKTLVGSTNTEANPPPSM